MFFMQDRSIGCAKPAGHDACRGTWAANLLHLHPGRIAQRFKHEDLVTTRERFLIEHVESFARIIDRGCYGIGCDHNRSALRIWFETEHQIRSWRFEFETRRE